MFQKLKTLPKLFFQIVAVGGASNVAGPSHSLLRRAVDIHIAIACSGSDGPIPGVASDDHVQGRPAVEGICRVLELASTAAGAAPGAGTAVKGIIDCVLQVLAAFETYNKNKGDIAHIKSKHSSLCRQLSNISESFAGSSESSMTALRMRLEEQLKTASNNLNSLRDCPKIQYQSVAEAINNYYRDVDSALVEFTALNSMQTGERVGAMQLTLRKIENWTLQQSMIVTSGMVSLTDITGMKHSIPRDWMMSFERFRWAIQTIYPPHSPQAGLLCQLVQDGLFDLCIDDGGQLVQIKSNEDLSNYVSSNTPVSMRAIMFQARVSGPAEEYQCPLCKTWNPVPSSEDFTVDCSQCDSRFQTTEADNRLARLERVKGYRRKGKAWLIFPTIMC